MAKLTKEEAQQVVQSIANSADNPASAHEGEDGLYLEFIEAISNGEYTIDEAKEIATILKSSQNIDFARWYA